MITIISPSKTQDFNKSTFNKWTIPRQFNESLKLINELKKLTKDEIAKLMKLSAKLAELNYERFQNFQKECTINNAKQAILAFKGDVYQGFEINDYDDQDFEFAQNNLCILSGLYGVLKPLDLIQPYRLEMGTNLKNSLGKNLYQFWGTSISEVINKIETKVIINLASNEYFKAIDKKALLANIITVDFKENKNGSFKTIGIYAKKARGLMANYMIKNRINNPEKLKKFTLNNYQFNLHLSTENNWVFTR
ncbi:UPF0246 protein YaaA [hydrothermal vent metagenome]|uniref:UPF0246 protein YaaA n=1 Tax=hydrothermal vent metagenome TaxID=652676 RepID=A0A1W1CVS4_9ZZZZ